MNLRDRLIELVRGRAFKYSEEPSFRLSSGNVSRYYFNLKQVNYTPEGLYITGRLVYEEIQERGLRPRAVGGLTLGADPIAMAVARHSFDTKNPIDAFVIRKEPKGHGMGRQVEGNLRSGDPVVVLEDVVTTGGSTIKAIDAAEGFGLEILGVIALLDRCEEGGRENIERRGYPFHSILTINDIIKA
ncbi:orotate phosphoribosyltransferase [bacterium BMS3Bbin06]|nr:orotate phosphoribosyltransferase [bacterium BMS3Bbin06]